MKSRILSGTATLIAVIAVLTLCVVLSDNNPIVSVSTNSKADSIYAISYGSIWDEQTIELLKADIEYLKAAKMQFILPRDIKESNARGIVLIMECTDSHSMELISSIIADHKIPTVFSIGKKITSTDILKLRSTLGSEMVEIAYSFDKCGVGKVSAVAFVADAKLEFSEKYGEQCHTIIHKCNEIFCENWDVSTTESAFDGTTLFTYGNGYNTIPPAHQGILILTRIIRLPEWTIEEYFSSIVN